LNWYIAEVCLSIACALMMQSLLELTTQLSNSKTVNKKDNYCLLLELFLSIEDGQCDNVVDLKGIYSDFQDFASKNMMADLADPAGSDFHDTILQIVALCFSNIEEWGDKYMSCLEKMMLAVCQVILNEDMCLLARASKQEEIILTAVFSLDHSMPVLTLDQRNLLIEVFNHVLQSSNENELTRIYAYRAAATFFTDIISSDLQPKDMIALLKIPFVQDLTNSDLDVRNEARLFLESIPRAHVQELHVCDDENLRMILSFLRYK
jgi:hypothetical protein